MADSGGPDAEPPAPGSHSEYLDYWNTNYSRLDEIITAYTRRQIAEKELTMGKTIITAETGTPFIEIVREFNTTPEFLLRAFTDPELFTQWVGPRRLTTKIDQFEAKNGGVWRYRSIDTDGSEYGFRGVFHGDPSTTGITQTFEYDGAPGQVALETMTFEPNGKTTTIRQRSVYPSVEARDGMAQSGMETGVNEGMARLDELIERLGAQTAAAR